MQSSDSILVQDQPLQSYYPFGEAADVTPVRTYIGLFIKNFVVTISSQLKALFTGLYHYCFTLQNSSMIVSKEFSEGRIFTLINEADNVSAHLLKFDKKTGSTGIKILSKDVETAISALKLGESNENTLYIPVGHSMGGMVAKFTQKEANEEDCFVQVNAPNFGSAPLGLFKHRKSSVFSQNFHPHGEIAQESRQLIPARLAFLSSHDALLPLTRQQRKSKEILRTAHSAVLAHKPSLEKIAIEIHAKFSLSDLPNNKSKIGFVFIHGLNANPGQMYPLAKKVMEKYSS